MTGWPWSPDPEPITLAELIRAVPAAVMAFLCLLAALALTFVVYGGMG